jgi:ketosteroid isomerase-like protein
VEPADWIEGYRRAWEERDPEAAAALFTEDASYRSSPFREPPHLGREGVVAYWTEATSSQADVEVEMGEPLVDGDHAAVEWWTRMRAGGEEITLVGCLLLRFAPDGRREDLREYWNYEGGRLAPHEGWGSWRRG